MSGSSSKTMGRSSSKTMEKDAIIKKANFDRTMKIEIGVEHPLDSILSYCEAYQDQTCTAGSLHIHIDTQAPSEELNFYEFGILTDFTTLRKSFYVSIQALCLKVKKIRLSTNMDGYRHLYTQTLVQFVVDAICQSLNDSKNNIEDLVLEDVPLLDNSGTYLESVLGHEERRRENDELRKERRRENDELRKLYSLDRNKYYEPRRRGYDEAIKRAQVDYAFVPLEHCFSNTLGNMHCKIKLLRIVHSDSIENEKGVNEILSILDALTKPTLVLKTLEIPIISKTEFFEKILKLVEKGLENLTLNGYRHRNVPEMNMLTENLPIENQLKHLDFSKIGVLSADSYKRIGESIKTGNLIRLIIDNQDYTNSLELLPGIQEEGSRLYLLHAPIFSSDRSDEVFKTVKHKTALRFLYDEPPGLAIRNFNSRVNSQWFRILLLLLVPRTRPHLLIKEIIKMIGYNFSFK